MNSVWDHFSSQRKWYFSLPNAGFQQFFLRGTILSKKLSKSMILSENGPFPLRGKTGPKS